MREYSEDEYLPLSGIQHYAFCPRQWALIHIEQQWEENGATVEGERVHERCHDASIRERRGDLLIVRGLRVSSSRLGLSGICDVVEFRADDEGVKLSGLDQLWTPIPVEYKRGKRKIGDEDRLQVCAQAMALEEMFGRQIDKAYLYYDSEKHREEVPLTEELRHGTLSLSERMHADFSRGHTELARRSRGCSSCSLKDICVPRLGKTKDVGEYVNEMIGGALS